jgi:hypothetical protein
MTVGGFSSIGTVNPDITHPDPFIGKSGILRSHLQVLPIVQLVYSCCQVRHITKPLTGSSYCPIGIQLLSFPNRLMSFKYVAFIHKNVDRLRVQRPLMEICVDDR